MKRRSFVSACLRVSPSREPGWRIRPTFRLTWRLPIRHLPYQAPRDSKSEPVPYDRRALPAGIDASAFDRQKPSLDRRMPIAAKAAERDARGPVASDRGAGRSRYPPARRCSGRAGLPALTGAGRRLVADLPRHRCRRLNEVGMHPSASVETGYGGGEIRISGITPDTSLVTDQWLARVVGATNTEMRRERWAPRNSVGVEAGTGPRFSPACPDSPARPGPVGAFLIDTDAPAGLTP